MKKNFAKRLLASLLLVCMVLSLPVFAVDRYYLKVTISEKNAPNYELTDYSGYLSLDESLTAEVAMVVGANFTEKNRQDRSGLYGFESPALHLLVRDGLKARQNGSYAWSNWVSKYYGAVSNVNEAAATLDLKAKLRDLTTKVSQLTPGVTYTIDYTPGVSVAFGDPARGNVYTVTITLCTGSVCDGGNSCPHKPFADLDSGKWYHEAVDYALRHGIMNGYGDNKFGPDDNLTRAMMVQILFNMEIEPKYTATHKFNDVEAGQWYVNAICWGSQKNVVAGYGNGKYCPDKDITREELVQILYNYSVKFKGYSADGAVALTAYTDADQVADYHKEAMEWGVGNGLLAGKGNGILDPKGTATRAEAAQMIWNFCENVCP